MSVRTFRMIRDKDVTGFSGTGTVFEGVRWSDGRVTIRWCVEGLPATTTDADSVDDIVQIHGHGGHSRLVWDDDPA